MIQQRYELNQHVSPATSNLAQILRPGDVEYSAEIDGRLDLVNDEVPEYRNEQAETFHRLYRAQSEKRQEELEKLYAELNAPQYLVVMFLCSGYQPFFENWLLSCGRHRIDPRGYTIAFTLDEKSAAGAQALGIKVCYLDPQIDQSAGGAQIFGDARFRNTILYKNAIIADSLKLGAPVLFQDADMIWFKDPFEYLRDHEAAYDMQIMYDGPNPVYRPLHGNTGFMYVCPTAAIQALFETALRNSASILERGGHQYPFLKILNYFVHHDLLKLHVLPEIRFLNGHLFNLERGVSPKAEDWERDGIVFHYSWSKGREDKHKKLDKFGLNYRSLLSTPDRATSDHDPSKEDNGCPADNEVQLTIHLAGSDSIELTVEREAPILGLLLNALVWMEHGTKKYSILRLETEEEGQPRELYLPISQISRIEIAPPLNIVMPIRKNGNIVRRGMGRVKRAVRHMIGSLS